MPMTKTEKAEMDNLRAARDMARALRWPEYAEPEMVPPPEWDKVQTGWLYNTARVSDYGGLGSAVYEAWSKSNTHGVGKHEGRIGSQRGIPLYASRLDALRGLRLALTEQYARTLAMVDAEIAAESSRLRGEKDHG